MLLSLLCLVLLTPLAAPADHAPPGMVWVPAGEFTMGWDGADGRADERPAHRVYVDGFWMDRTEVTNAQFRVFVESTGYVTTAEKAVDWEEMKLQVPRGTPKPPEDMLVPGSLVFVAPAAPVDLRDVSRWWVWTPGANWREPGGPGSSIKGRDDHPVVHVSWDDAAAYCVWAGKQLPTEAQWERAARLDHDGARYVWGDDLQAGDMHHANLWQGRFPDLNTGDDAFAAVAPVGQFPATELGLFDLAGNVWEWTADAYDRDKYARRVAARGGGIRCENPKASARFSGPPWRVQKGGSFLCHASYCSSYRPAAKMGTSPDTGASHLGFRCVKVVNKPDVFDELMPGHNDHDIWMLVAMASADRRDRGAEAINEVQQTVSDVWAASRLIGNRGFVDHEQDEFRGWVEAYRRIGARGTARSLEEGVAALLIQDEARRDAALVATARRFHALDDESEELVVQYIERHLDAAMDGLAPYLPRVLQWRQALKSRGGR